MSGHVSSKSMPKLYHLGLENGIGLAGAATVVRKRGAHDFSDGMGRTILCFLFECIKTVSTVRTFHQNGMVIQNFKQF